MYLKACKTKLIDLDTFKFINFEDRVRPSQIMVLPFHWFYGRNSSHRVPNSGCLMNKTEAFWLNNVEVVLSYGWRKADIRFPDPKTGKKHRMDVFCLVRAIRQGHTRPSGVDYTIRLDDTLQKIETPFDDSHRADSKFSPVVELDNVGIAKLSMFEELYFGVSPNQFEIIYRGKKLSGTSYALLMGTYAILLSDKLEFDSLVLLSAVETGKLTVDNIVYSVNPYLVKIKTLMK